MALNSQEIKVGDHVIVQRQGYTKLHKLKNHGNMVIGKFTVQMDNAIGQKYFDTFQMKNSPGNKKLFVLEKVEDVSSASSGVTIGKSGRDNRNILEDDDSQALTKADLDKLQASELNSNVIVGELINNSKTFNMKTEYSQEKYIKKKEKKYFEYIQLRRPTLRLLTNMFYRQDPTKTLGIRIDDLSQILSHGNIHSTGNHLLYDSGTSGLMTAALMNAIGANTRGVLIHMHPGNECQKNAFIAMQFPQEQRDRCINVNIYSVLRCFYQNKNDFNKIISEVDDKTNLKTQTIDQQSRNLEACVETDETPTKIQKLDKNLAANVETVKSPTKKQKLDDSLEASAETDKPPKKKQKLNDNLEAAVEADKLSTRKQTLDENLVASVDIDKPLPKKQKLDENHKANTETNKLPTEKQKLDEKLESNAKSNEPLTKKQKLDENPNTSTPKPPQWQLDNEQACQILQNKCDSLIITAKEHPVNIVKELLQFLKGGRQLVVFSLIREPLHDLFLYLKGRLDIVAIRLSSNFLRNYQVLPERTHPEVMMNSGGFILTAVKLNG